MVIVLIVVVWIMYFALLRDCTCNECVPGWQSDETEPE
jgi:hypothetical protein